MNKTRSEPTYTYLPFFRQGSIYVIRSGDLYKIGRTVSVAHRLYALKATASLPLEVVYSAAVNDYVLTEYELHQQFKQKRVSGEWFRLGPRDLTRIRGYLEREQRLFRAHAQQVQEATSL
jgi:hypothetical protein